MQSFILQHDKENSSSRWDWSMSSLFCPLLPNDLEGRTMGISEVLERNLRDFLVRCL